MWENVNQGVSLHQTNIYEKLRVLPQTIEDLLGNRAANHSVPEEPGRDAPVVTPAQQPGKKGLSFAEGQAHLLHNLASIELQAMELGLRTLTEFPEAHADFREQLAAITIEEGKHLKLCLDGIEKLGFKWGDWPVHIQLWQATSREDSLIDRVLIVHRYLEGSGLDAGETLLRRLGGIAEGNLHKVAKVIFEDEISHVDFGTRWYKEFCRLEGIDPADHFGKRLEELRWRIPRRIEKIGRESRMKAGFTESELTYLESLRNEITKF